MPVLRGRVRADLPALRSACLSLTFDDAPSIRRESPVVFDAERMRAIRETLQRNAVADCAAFVVGESVGGHEAQLRDWLAAGFTLANHTWSHKRCSDCDAGAFAADVQRCEELLEHVGAHSRGEPRLFRFPYLDIPRSPEQRRAVMEALAGMRLRIAHACVDLHDWRYEVPLAHAIASGDERLGDAIAWRYVETALRALAHAIGGLRRRHGDFPCIVYAHFGAVTTRALPLLLEELAVRGVRWMPLEEAIEHPIYRQFEEVPGSTGRVADLLLPSSRWSAIRRRLAAVTRPLRAGRERRLGPRWPHVD